MKLIQLTFYKPPHKYGGSGGATKKTFHFNPATIESMVEYNNSTKITSISGQEIEVCESVKDIIKKVNGDVIL